MTSSSEISVVVQGAVDPQYAPQCLQSIRKILPQAEIVLSTWENTNVSDLSYDKLVINKDPGGYPMSPWETNNSKRQIVSTVNGIKESSRRYVLKLRSDLELTGTGFLKYFKQFPIYKKEWHFITERIVIPSMITRDPRIWESPMCPSDWCSFGLREDMLMLWDIPLPDEVEQNWFLHHAKPDSVRYYYEPLQARYNPEQSIWTSFVRKFKSKLHSDHMFDINAGSIDETLLSFANNLIILSCEQYGIRFLKTHRQGGDLWHVITYNDFVKIYNQFAGGRKGYFPINFQRVRLFPYFKASNKRLYEKAVEYHRCRDYLYEEISYTIRSLISCLRPWERKEPNFQIKCSDNSGHVQ